MELQSIIERLDHKISLYQDQAEKKWGLVRHYEKLLESSKKEANEWAGMVIATKEARDMVSVAREEALAEKDSKGEES